MDLMTVNEYLRYATFAVMLLRLVVVVGYGRQGSLLWTFVLPHGAVMLLIFYLAARASNWATIAPESVVVTAAWTTVLAGQGAATIAGWWPSEMLTPEQVIARAEEAAARTEVAAAEALVASVETQRAAQKAEVAAETVIERMDRREARSIEREERAIEREERDDAREVRDDAAEARAIERMDRDG